MKISVDQFVDAYVTEMAATANDLDRSVTTPSGLDAEGMLAALTDPRMGRLGIPLMADLMAPQGSLYFDAIFGAFYGQTAIRKWLVPAMAEIEFVDFVPTSPGVLFDDGNGGTSLDEWNMVANIGDMAIPLSRGVSVRRYRDGWITWACDVYDTGAMRQPPPPDAGIEAAPLPAWPHVEWITDHAATPAQPSVAARAWLDSRAPAGATSLIAEAPSGLTNQDLSELVSGPILCSSSAVACELFHPTDSVYLDPLFGEFRGQQAVRLLLTEIGPKLGNFVAEPLGPRLFDGTTSVQEWKLMAVLPDASRVMLVRGTSVRRFADGWVTYAADYFDTAPLADDEIKAAARAAGSTLTAADVAQHRSS